MSLSIVIPVFNENNNIKPFLNKINPILKKIVSKYEIIFVLDPSEDNTEEVILNEIKKDKKIKMIKFSRRFGQPAALLAGIKNSVLDNVVLIDVDLQDPPELIEEMYKLRKENYETVLAKRSKKDGENLIRKIISYCGYKLINILSETNIPENVGEFRLISRKIVEEIKKMEEKDFFLRGANSYIGFKQKIIYFERDSRKEGETKYNKYTGSFRIGLNGIFSFSTKPLHLITIISSISFLLTTSIFILYLVLTALKLFVFKYQFFIITLILLVSSLIFFSLGIIAEYLARLIPDIKKRPTYIVDKKYNFDSD
jgi:polyisoprenyl-phosphate glycosyltransferase